MKNAQTFVSALSLDDMAELLQAIEILIDENTNSPTEQTDFYYLLAEHCRAKLISTVQ